MSDTINEPKVQIYFIYFLSLYSYFRANSFNVRSKHECLENWFSSDKKKHYSSANNQADCEERGGQWTEIFNYLERLTGEVLFLSIMTSWHGSAFRIIGLL